MPPIRDAIRYPAKRDRSARVSGYVAVWLPGELPVLYLEEGEVVTATVSTDGQRFTPMAISEAISHVPTAAEYGSICFHEATDEQVDLMYATQTGESLPLPRELKSDDAAGLLAYLDGTMHDGALEVIADGSVNYIVIDGGRPVRGYFVDSRPGDVTVHLRTLAEGRVLAAPPTVRLWPSPAPLPHQASPALIQAYRELIGALTARLRESGKTSAAEVTEGARRALAVKHPTPERFSPSLPTTKDPVTDAQTLTKAIASWTADILWAACPDDTTPEQMLRDLTSSRRHVFQAAGLFDALPWKVQW